jgi:hypothetical protein
VAKTMLIYQIFSYINNEDRSKNVILIIEKKIASYVIISQEICYPMFSRLLGMA